ncbi:exopolyphosphatase [Nematocida sp. AWRm80]|nr:exopolyphosphatase [Nematocida sp. AWRm80]
MNKYKSILSKYNLKDKLNRIYSKEIEKSEIVSVLGNPSCDQDSFIGSLVYGLVMDRLQVMVISKRVVSQKKDIMGVIEICGLSIEDIVFLEYEGDKAYLVRGSTKTDLKDRVLSCTLVDHNLPEVRVFSSKFFKLERVIDHHPILEYHPFYSHVTGLLIELNAGSCCSLLYKEIKSVVEHKIDEYAYIFILSIAIATDTSLLTNRTHDVDRIAVGDLLKIASLTPTDLEEAHKEFKKRKRCESEVDTDVILMLDYKQYSYPKSNPEEKRMFGISSVKWKFDEWLARDKKDKFLSEIEKYIKKQKIEFLIIGSSCDKLREYTVFNAPGTSATGSDLPEKAFLHEETQPKPRHPLNIAEITIYTTATSLSRKLLAPKVYTYLKDQK